MKTNLKFFVAALLLLICNFSMPAFAQNAIKQATPEEIQKAKAAVEANPDSLSAHKAYIKTMGASFDKVNPDLVAQYNKWIDKYPKNVNFPFAIGEALWDSELPEAKAYLLKVVQMDPKNATAWFYLSIDADRWGQEDKSAEYMKQASLADPSNSGYAFYYLNSFENIDSAAYHKMVNDFVKRFPADERGAQAMYWFAERTTDKNARIKYFEQLHDLYPPKKFGWSADGMAILWGAYLETDAVKAQNLVIEVGGDDKYWKLMGDFTGTIIQVRKLSDAHQYKEALTLLEQAKKPRYPDVSGFFYREEAALLDKTGNTKGAYDSLSAKFAKAPDEDLLAATEMYGTKLGKSKIQIQKDVQNLRDAAAKTASPFDLGLYTSAGKLSLNDLKGKVVLLTFWFPGCGPCRGEFPHFQAVMNEYKGQDVEYIGINVSPGQDPYVIPFMQNTHYTFKPLHGTDDVIKAYGVRGEPENFLIDKNGKIVFTDFRIEGSNHSTLEMMISSLLHPID